MARTAGMTPAAIRLLESLSAYRNLHATPGAVAAPVCHSHYRFTLEDRQVSVVSRIGPNGVDSSGRPNKLAHHLLLYPEERPQAGPLWLAAQEGLFADAWQSPPCEYAEEPSVPVQREDPLQGGAWKKTTGDAGWAGVLAGRLMRSTPEPVVIVYDAGAPVLDLLREAAALVPQRSRWRISFSTYYARTPPGTDCLWRCCLRDSPAAREAGSSQRCTVIDLADRRACQESDDWIRLAREGGTRVTETAGPGAEGGVVLMENRKRKALRLKPVLRKGDGNDT